MKIKILISIIAFFIISNTALAENKESFAVPAGGGIVYGSEIGIGVSAPNGWIFDNKSGVRQGLHAVIYPEGSSWANSNQMMYVNIGKMEPGEALENFIQGDIDRFVKNSPNLKVEKMNSLTIQGGIKAEVRQFTGDKWGNYERIAYAQKGSSVAMYVLSSKSKNGYEKSISAFEEMVTKSFLTIINFGK
jgi:hypothetical protein